MTPEEARRERAEMEEYQRVTEPARAAAWAEHERHKQTLAALTELTGVVLQLEHAVTQLDGTLRKSMTVHTDDDFAGVHIEQHGGAR